MSIKPITITLLLATAFTLTGCQMNKTQQNTLAGAGIGAAAGAIIGSGSGHAGTGAAIGAAAGAVGGSMMSN